MIVGYFLQSLKLRARLCGDVSLARMRGFLRDTRANTAMMFGLSLVPILIATGAGIDFARGVMLHQRVSQALDAAALAVGNETTKPSACSSSASAGSASNEKCKALREVAQKYFDENFKSDSALSDSAPVVDIDIAGQAVTLKASLPLKLTLLGIAPVGVASPTVSASSTVVWGQTKLWVALVLDNSGSMSQGDSSGSKMSALKDALTNTDYGLLKTLQAAAASDGDVMVGIVPFTRSVNMGYSAFRNSPFIDWGEWEAPPANAGTLSGNLGPGDNCPWSSWTHGFRCTTGSTNGSSNTSTIPASGLICPGLDFGSVNSDHKSRYYNGCFDSVPTKTLTTTTTVSTPTTVKQNCSQTGTGTITCTQSSSTTGSSTTNTSTATTSGYTGASTTTSSSSSSTTSDGSKSCNNKNPKTCTWVRTIVTTEVDTTVAKTGAEPYSHTWIVNSRDSWSGCVMDRQRKDKQTQVNGGTGWRTPAAYDYDASNTAPSNNSAGDDTQFPAENASSCLSASVQTLTSNWTTLSSQVSGMSANGSTNQGIGVAHGFQMLGAASPYTQPTLKEGTTKILILFSDGLNTQNRWWGDGMTEGTTEDGYIDARMKATCTAAKNAGIVVYAIYVHIGTNGSSSALQNCASSSDKYYDLTSSAAIKDAFKDIAQKITNLRVSQ